MAYRVLVSLAAFVLLTAAPTFAQTAFSAGVKAGVNFSNVSFDPDDDDCCDSRVGFVGGLFTTASLTDAVSIQPEFLFSMRGFKEDDEEVKLNYFEIPILLRADFTTGGNVRPFVVIGPSLAFKLSAKVEEDGEEFDIDDDVEGFDAGLAIGAGLQFGRGSIEGRYTHGLSDADPFDEDKARHRVFSFLAGFRF